MSHSANLDEVMAAGAAHAVQFAARFNVPLDYSMNSIRTVEEQLSSLHKAIPRGFFAKLVKRRPTDIELHKAALTFGAYVGEVLRRQYGGHWLENNSLDQRITTPTLHLGNSGIEVWPQVKVEKRLRNGPEDNVWHNAQTLGRRLENQPTDGAA